MMSTIALSSRMSPVRTPTGLEHILRSPANMVAALMLGLCWAAYLTWTGVGPNSWQSRVYGVDQFSPGPVLVEKHLQVKSGQRP